MSLCNLVGNRVSSHKYSLPLTILAFYLRHCTVFGALIEAFHKQNAIGEKGLIVSFLHFNAHPEVYTTLRQLHPPQRISILSTAAIGGAGRNCYPSNIILHFLFYSNIWYPWSDTMVSSAYGWVVSLCRWRWRRRRRGK